MTFVITGPPVRSSCDRLHPLRVYEAPHGVVGPGELVIATGTW